MQTHITFQIVILGKHKGTYQSVDEFDVLLIYLYLCFLGMQWNMCRYVDSYTLIYPKHHTCNVHTSNAAYKLFAHQFIKNAQVSQILLRY